MESGIPSLVPLTGRFPDYLACGPGGMFYDSLNPSRAGLS
jgi:hypothetical protein